MNIVKKLICILLFLACLLLAAIACGPKEEAVDSETVLITEGEGVSESEEEGTGLNDKDELDSPDYGPLFLV